MHFIRIILLLTSLTITACNGIPPSQVGWWQESDGSITINNMNKMGLESRWYIASRNDKACAVWNSYMGGTLLSSNLYLGYFSQGKGYLFKRKVLFSLGKTDWEYTEPIIISTDDDTLLVQLEPPLDQGSIREVRYKRRNKTLIGSKPMPDGSFRSRVTSRPIYEKMECENALTNQ